MAARNRRWCQGNLQHAGVIGAAGLHMLTDIVAYASAPLWMAMLLLGLGVSAQARLLRPEYFPEAYALFPQWHVVDAERAAWVLAATLALLLAPKDSRPRGNYALPQWPQELGRGAAPTRWREYRNHCGGIAVPGHLADPGCVSRDGPLRQR